MLPSCACSTQQHVSLCRLTPESHSVSLSRQAARWFSQHVPASMTYPQQHTHDIPVCEPARHVVLFEGTNER
eukprot:m.106831 g.106831  ORF g.106831 m.106831 type:complete len:72 (-) comp15804_c0_seq1:75-290(-)